MANLQENICALCDATIDIDIVMDHSCYEGYNRIHVDDAGYVYPKRDDGMIVDPINETQDESLTEVLRNEMLIGEIQKREPLWNFRIPVAERGRTTVQKLWEEVVSAMNGNVKDVIEAKNIWKKMRYNYSRIVAREKGVKKSGSAGSGIKKNKWPYYQMMAFTKDLFVENRKRSSNISMSNFSDDESVASTSSSSAPKEETKRKQRNSSERENSLNRTFSGMDKFRQIKFIKLILPKDTISSFGKKLFLFGKSRSTESNEAMLMKLTAMLDTPAPTPPELVLPPLPAIPPQNDDIENVIGLVRASLNRIPVSKRKHCILELLTFLYSREDSYR